MKRLLLLLLLFLPLALMAKGDVFDEMRRDKSRRGSEISVKALVSPGGFYSVYNGSGYVQWGAGLELAVHYRFNEAYSFGVGVNFIGGAHNHRENAVLSGSVFADFKVNFAEREKFTPYVSLGFGLDWMDKIVNPFGGKTYIYDDDVYAKHPYWMIVMPACGLDFPLRNSRTAFVEFRFNYRVTDLCLPTFAVGYTF